MDTSPSSSLSVLCVDDDEDLLELTAIRLEEVDDALEVSTAAGPESALDRLAERRFDCIVSDYQMPGMDGLDLLAAVRERHGDLPFVLFTGRGSEEVASDAISAGVSDYIQKEPRSDQFVVLANRIQNLVSKHAAESELGRRTAEFRTLADSAPVPMVVYAPDGTVQFANDAAVSFYGAESQGDLLGIDVLDLVHEADREQARERLDHILETGEPAPPSDQKVRDLDGNEKYTRVATAPVTFGGEPAMQTVVHDVTDAVDARTELSRERQRFSSLFSLIPEACVTYRFEGETPIVTAVNPAFEETFGYDEETLVGSTPKRFIVPAEEGETSNALTAQANAGEQVVDTVVRETADGERRTFRLYALPLDASVDNEGFALYVDITDRQRREDRLARLHGAVREQIRAETPEAICRTAVETAADDLNVSLSAVWLHDEASDALEPAATSEYATELFPEIPRFERGEALAWQVFESGRRRVYDDLHQEEGRYNPETPIQSEIVEPLGDHGVMILGATEPAAFDEVDRLLTRLLAANTEAALTRIDRETALAQRNERLSEFADIVSHDLRTPLSVIRGSLDLLDAETAQVERATEAADRMERIIDDLLTLAKQGEEIDERDPVDLATLAEACWSTVATGDLELDVDTDTVLAADESRLRQLLENLFRNAADHAGEDVTVRVADLDDGEGFVVEDDGMGIPPDDRDEVLAHGYSTDAGGTGLGLAIVLEVVEAHDWTVDLSESESGGVRFEFRTGG